MTEKFCLSLLKIVIIKDQTFYPDKRKLIATLPLRFLAIEHPISRLLGVSHRLINTINNSMYRVSIPI